MKMSGKDIKLNLLFYFSTPILTFWHIGMGISQLKKNDLAQKYFFKINIFDDVTKLRNLSFFY